MAGGIHGMPLVVVLLAVAADIGIAGGTGTLDKVSGWYPAGSNLTVTATPAKFSVFSAWTGDTDLCVQEGNRITIPVDGARRVNALFVLKKAPKGTTESWLAAYELTNSTPEEAELLDIDGDGAPTWQEYLAGTDPTNINDRLDVQVSSADGVLRVWFNTRMTTPDNYGSLVRQYTLEKVGSMTSTNWSGVPGCEEMPADNKAFVYTNSVSTNMLFFRVKAWLD